MESGTSQSQQPQPQSPTQTSSASDATIELMAWLDKNKKAVGIGVGVALVAIFVIMLVVQRQAEREFAASAALSEVRLPFSPAAALPAGTADALARVASEQKGSQAAARALLLSAGVLFSEAKSAADYAEAQKRFSQVLQDYPTSPWTPQANLGVAAALTAQGKTQEAIAKYEEINRRFASSSIIDESKLALARLYEAQKPEEAFKIYEELLKGSPNSVLTMEANMRQDDLLKARPELAKLKTPPTPPITMNPAAQNQQVKITPMTNRVTTNVQQAAGTNPAAVTQPVPIKLSPTPSPGAANPAPAK